MRRIYLTIILALSSILSFSQDIKYANYLIDSLSAPAMHGRGYVFQSDLTAAKFIKSELEKNNVLSFNKNYFQYFELNTNTFPGNMKVLINDNELIPGIDYLIASSSPTIKGDYKVEILDAKIIANKKKYRKFKQKKHSENFILIDTIGLNNPKFKETYDKIKKHNILKAKGIITIQDKNLTYVPSPIVNNFPVVEIKRQSLPSKIKNINIDIKSEYLLNYKTQNIVGYIEGEIDSFIVFSAHYDHIGRMGKNTYFPGANDNASGVAMLLDLAKTLNSRNQKPHYSIAFIFFSGEELGLLGSRYYTQNPVFELDKIKVLLNLDMVGSGDKGITIVNGKVFTSEFDKLKNINDQQKYLPEVKSRGAAANSDHYFFYEKGVKSFFIYTRGEYKEYHNINDKYENLPLNKFEELEKLLLDFIEK